MHGGGGLRDRRGAASAPHPVGLGRGRWGLARAAVAQLAGAGVRRISRLHRFQIESVIETLVAEHRLTLAPRQDRLMVR